MTTTTTQVPVGDLHCQHDTYCKEYYTHCISCSEKPDKKGFYQVKLHDTILFPEGGGQPNDTGYINDIRVYNVQRQQLEHIHYTKEPVQVGSKVKLTLDWERRFDHVQQHTGQHLLSAILEKPPYSIETVGWCMKEKTSYVELGTAGGSQPTQEQLDEVEQKINDMILQSIPVKCHTTAMNHNDDDSLRPDSLPADYVGSQGVIRTIEIEGVDRNPCCGTHLRDLGHLQQLKLLHTETIRGGNTRLYFVFGQRVVDNLGELYDLSRQLTKLLSVPPKDYLDSINRLQLQLRTQTKLVKKWQSQLATYAIKDLQVQLKTSPVALVYDEEGEGGMPYLSLLAGLIKEANLLPDDDDDDENKKAIVLASGERSKGGVMLILSTDDVYLKKVATKAMSILSGAKGGGARGRWSGKATSFVNIEQILNID
ncbi:Threonyl/alanyl tRNA synthetase [Halteromyces radiatus]|uniref:Threonyl/alanyl tRNA synthetase n=1 Tax=Halteromyces radiatus TaxID=101107 RepID=UPI00221EB6E5|nr:Threonyl/alanyl tRNA synthetase [Halteromyces radiatus]KAI8083156.1 Threonyl/alanyl tRNA synthetase [Halteromyces radiatus]